MATETHKKRQKEAARREKKQQKAARLAERRNKKEKGLQEEKPHTEEPKGKPIYFRSAELSRDPQKKSVISLHNLKGS